MSDHGPTLDELFEATVSNAADSEFRKRARAEFDRRIAEVERAAAEKAYEQGRLDERHDCNRYAEYQQGKITEEQYQRGVRSRNPYRAAALGLTAGQEGKTE